MKKTIEFEHGIKDRVKINEIDRVGVVTGLLHNNQGNQYQVVFWDNAKRESLWLYAWEINPCAG
jgi:hypothetical protein